ncbi:hypothetical protein BSKO_04510 [Bryopsis sp. KO-2023]|nr:hypothetical protein BSKO_04510 [Bryopsis sp. KO-2023]
MLQDSESRDGEQTYETLGQAEKALLNYQTRFALAGARLENLKKFSPKPSDVFLLSPTKSGTTWVQQIMHGLRSRGSMDFDSINGVVPMLETALDDGHDIHGDQPYSPRCFKTHSCWEDRPRGHKYIILVRDPKDRIVSMFEFMQGWAISSDISLDSFAKVFGVHHVKDIFPTTHDAIASWWPHRKNPGTLWLHYEDLKLNLPTVVELIANFMGFDTGDKELLDIVTKQASFQFMKAHEDKFRLEHSNSGSNKAPSKVNKGVANRKNLLPGSASLCMDADWKRFVEPVTGFSTYADLRNHVNQELGRPWALQE